MTENTMANQSVEPTGGSRSAETAFLSHWRLPPVAHAWRYAMRLAALMFTLAFATSCTQSKSRAGVATAERDRIASIAKRVVAANDTWADRAAYEVTRNGQGWSVTAWRIEGRDLLGRPQFTPGGFRDIEIDEQGNVTSYHRGY